jgi:hypothetical protein
MIILLVKRADFYADGATMELRIIWNAFGVIKHGYQPVFMLDGFIIEGIWGIITDITFTRFATI